MRATTAVVSMVVAGTSVPVLAQNAWSGQGAGGSGTDWSVGSNYVSGSPTFNTSTDLNFGTITTGGPFTFTAAAGTYAARDLQFGTTASTISTAENITLSGTGVPGATTLNLARDIYLPSPAGSLVTLASDLRLDLTNAAHVFRFAQNSAVTTSTPSTAVPVIRVASQITGGGASATLSSSFTNYGPSLGITPAVLLSNDTNDFNGRIGGATGVQGRFSYTSIADAGVASALGAGTGGNANINLANGAGFDYVGSASRSSDRPINYSGTVAIENLSPSGSATLTLSGAMTNAGTSGTTTLRLGSTAGNVLKLEGVIADGVAATTRVSVLSNTSSNYVTAGGTLASASFTNGTVALAGLNTYTGVTQIDGSIANVTHLANVNTASGLGKGSAAGSAGDLLFGNGTLQHTAANAASTNRLFTIGTGNGNGATLDSSSASREHTLRFTGSGAIAFVNNSAHTLTLTGTNTGRNEFNPAVANFNANTTTITKTGNGAWFLTGTNSYTGGTNINGGYLILANTAAKSAGTTVVTNPGSYVGLGVGGAGYFNATQVDQMWNNTLAGVTVFSAANVAIDANSGDFTYATSQAGTRSFAKFGGSKLIFTGNMSYSGSTTIFDGTLQIGNGGTGGRLGVNSAITVLGTLAFDQSDAVVQGVDFSSAGIAGSGGLTQSGSGALTLNAANSYTGPTTVSAGRLIVAAAGSINGSSGVQILAGELAYNSTTPLTAPITSFAPSAVLSGSGEIDSIVGGEGIISPGNSPGVLTVAQLDPSGGQDFAFELTAPGAPSYGNVTASVNDVLRIANASAPLLSALDGDNIVSVYLNAGSLQDGDTFVGGFYTDRSQDFLAEIASAAFSYYIADPAGLISFSGVTYSPIAAFDPAMSISVGVIAQSADFGGGAVTGYSTTFSVVVPEPSGLAAICGGLLAVIGRRKRWSDRL